MATTLYFTSNGPFTQRGNNDAKLNGTASWWDPFLMDVIRGTGVLTRATATVAGPTNGVEAVGIVAGPLPLEWVTDPLAADVTIAGTMTFNLWANESGNSANAAINCAVDKIDGAAGTLTRIVTTARVTELSTTNAAVNFTATPTSTACKKGDRLRFRVFADDAGTMGSGLTFSFAFSGATSAASGDSFVTFTETFTFTTATPTGSVYYMTNTAAGISPGSATANRAATTRGGSSVTATTNTAAGPVAPIQITATAGGTALEWYTPPLNAVTLGGMARVANASRESSAAINASIRAEIAVTATNGTGATVWATGCLGFAGGELDITFANNAVDIAGADTAVTAGQRLRLRLYVDDYAYGPLVTGGTVDVAYNGTANNNDVSMTLPVTVTEQATGSTYTKAGYAKESA